MILPDVTKRSRRVVKRAAFFGANRFEEPDFDFLNQLFSPRNLEEVIRKTERQDVLQHFLREIVIDAINLLLFEEFRESIVDCVRSPAVVTKRFLHDNPRPPAVYTTRLGETAFCDMTRNRRVKLWRHSEIEELVCTHTPFRIELVDCLFERRVTCLFVEITALETKHFDERFDFCWVKQLCRVYRNDRFDMFAEFRIAPRPAREADDAEHRWEFTFRIQMEQCGHYFDPHEVSRGAERDKYGWDVAARVEHAPALYRTESGRLTRVLFRRRARYPQAPRDCGRIMMVAFELT